MLGVAEQVYQEEMEAEFGPEGRLRMPHSPPGGSRANHLGPRKQKGPCLPVLQAPQE